MGLVKRVIACDPHADDAAFAERGVTRVSKEELLSQADIIVNHMCLTDDNVRFFDEAAFDAMARRPIFINLGRGLCVDEEALVDALDAGKLRAFGADVLYDETWPRTSWWGATTSSSRPILRFTRPRLSKTWSV